MVMVLLFETKNKVQRLFPEISLCIMKVSIECIYGKTSDLFYRQ
jgi:hypothetical protein